MNHLGLDNYIALPTRTSMNPAHPETAEYYDPHQTAYILFKSDGSRSRPTRVYTSFGGFAVVIGDTMDLYHDQSGGYLGRYDVVGIKHFASGESAGTIPDAKIKHCVAK